MLDSVFGQFHRRRSVRDRGVAIAHSFPRHARRKLSPERMPPVGSCAAGKTRATAAMARPPASLLDCEHGACWVGVRAAAYALAGASTVLDGAGLPCPRLAEELVARLHQPAVELNGGLYIGRTVAREVSHISRILAWTSATDSDCAAS